MKAYDLALGEWRNGVPDKGRNGWCFGLPSGITGEQWPLDPVGGYPLVHGFTLLLPEDYRVHGPEIVALSFFATPADGNDGGARPWRRDIQALIDAAGEEPPADSDLHPWWQRARAGHPRLHRMRDILNYAYAVILLTQAEYEGPPCPPPALVDGSRLGRDQPGWFAHGAAAAFETFSGRSAFDPTSDRWSIHRPLIATERRADPNAGLAPRETWDDEPADTGYRPYFYWEGGVIELENWRERDWSQGHAANHIGGTMRPSQAVPEFSPFYIEFEEDMGGYNFGGGNAQLDFGDMQFDWACG